jgi:hypothetical protein
LEKISLTNLLLASCLYADLLRKSDATIKISLFCPDKFARPDLPVDRFAAHAPCSHARAYWYALVRVTVLAAADAYRAKELTSMRR